MPIGHFGSAGPQKTVLGKTDGSYNKRLFSAAHQKAIFISSRFVLFGDFIAIPDHQIITALTVATSALADQLTMDLRNPEEIAVAQKRQDM